MPENLSTNKRLEFVSFLTDGAADQGILQRNRIKRDGKHSHAAFASALLHELTEGSDLFLPSPNALLLWPKMRHTPTLPANICLELGVIWASIQSEKDLRLKVADTVAQLLGASGAHLDVSVGISNPCTSWDSPISLEGRAPVVYRRIPVD